MLLLTDGAVVLQVRFGNCDKEILLPYSMEKEREFAQWGPSLSGQTQKHATTLDFLLPLAATVVDPEICPLYDGPFVFVITLLKPLGMQKNGQPPLCENHHYRRQSISSSTDQAKRTDKGASRI